MGKNDPFVNTRSVVFDQHLSMHITKYDLLGKF